MEAKLRLPPFQAVVRLSMIRKALELVDEYSYVLIDIDSSTIMLDDATPPRGHRTLSRERARFYQIDAHESR